MACAYCDILRRSVEGLKRGYEHSRGLMEEVQGIIDAEADNRRKRLLDEAKLEYQLAVNELDQHMSTSHAAVNESLRPNTLPQDISSMVFTLAGFDQIANIRHYHFDGRNADRTRQPFVVSVDLDLIHRYRIPLQELPILCRGVLERGTDMASMMFTEADMVMYAEKQALVAAEPARKYKTPRSAVKRPSPPAWSRRDWINK